LPLPRIDRIADRMRTLGLDPHAIVESAAAASAASLSAPSSSSSSEATDAAAPAGRKKGGKAAAAAAAAAPPSASTVALQQRDAASVLPVSAATVESLHAQRFGALVGGAEKYEVCRVFLASLQLANNGNVDIVHTDDASYALQLLSTEPVRPEL
jgi:hypothetical protein